MAKQFLISLLVTVSIPAIGFGIGTWIIFDVNSTLELPFDLLCGTVEFENDAEIQAACDQLLNIVLLRDASLWAGGVALGLMAVYLISSLIAGSSRRLNALIFPKLVPLSTIVIAGLVLIEGAILTYSAYIGESYWIGRVHFFLIGLIGLGAGIGGLSLLAQTFSLKKRLVQPEFGKLVQKIEAPRLWKFVEKITETLDARLPQNIVVGLAPNFYATAADVRLLNEGQLLSGETLYLSLPLMRLFSPEELQAVIGHELGHFKGGDVAYSLKFAPVYRGLGTAIDSLADENGGVTSLAKLPALAMLSLMHEIFSRNERSISRNREFEADKAGVNVSSVEALAVSLGKVAVFSPLWEGVRAQNVERLNDGKVSGNLSQVFQDSARFDVSHAGVEELMDQILATRISHPTDTHPTIAERFSNIGFEPKALSVSALTEVGGSAVALLDSIAEIEKDLTIFEHRLMVSLGHVTPPNGEAEHESNGFLHAMYTLAAAMVGADGKVEASEIAEAEAIGSNMFANFDPIEFRGYCNSPDELTPFSDTVDILGPALKDEHKPTIFEYLEKIAMADGELAEEEKGLLDYVKNKWELRD